MRHETASADPAAPPHEEKRAPAPAPQKDGFFDRLRANTPSVIRDNAPRIVAPLKIAGSLAMMKTKSWPFKAAGSFFIAGNLIMMAFGHKKTDEERERLQKEEAEQKAAQGGKPENRVTRHLYKVFHPQKYPLESGLTVFNLGSIFWALAGAVGTKANRSPWYLLGGLFSLASDANGAFNKEKLDDADERAGQSKMQATFTYLKNRPVLASSLLNVGADITTATGGAIKYFKNQEGPWAMLAGSFILLANAFQAVFVTRNDYNIEKKQGGAVKAPVSADPAAASAAEANALAPDTKVKLSPHTPAAKVTHAHGTERIHEHRDHELIRANP
jgi:hypothetical protein